MPAPVPPNEVARLMALRAHQILDTSPEKVFDDLTQLAADLCETPVAMVTLIDEHRQWFKSKVGVEISETPREVAFCAYTILVPGVLEVPDATNDPRFKYNPLVTGAPGVRFYAGVAVTTSDGHSVGTLCVVDSRPRNLSERQTRALTVLAHAVSAQIQLRRKVSNLSHVLASRDEVVAEVEEELSAANAKLAALPTCPACQQLRTASR